MSGANSLLDAGPFLFVGFGAGSSGGCSVSSGGTISANHIELGTKANASGSISIRDPGSSVTSICALFLGCAGHAFLARVGAFTQDLL